MLLSKKIDITIYKFVEKAFMIRGILVIVIALSVSSCYVSRHNYGDFQELKENKNINTHDKEKQFYLFWGLIALGRTNLDKPDSIDHYRIVTKFNVLDSALSYLTEGLVSMKTYKVEVIEVPDQAAREEEQEEEQEGKD